jgi:hypothetical protein
VGAAWSAAGVSSGQGRQQQQQQQQQDRCEGLRFRGDGEPGRRGQFEDGVFAGFCPVFGWECCQQRKDESRPRSQRKNGIPLYTPFSKQLINQLQVSEAKPKHYWLGRFVTLTNAFHYEDSFSEPDVATGFGMLSSYSFPAKDDADRSGYRVRRAFMVLENVCVTDEASWSFRRFRDEYVARYGRWVGY